MTISQFNEIIAHAESEQYAIGYFECWNLESLMAVADAAESVGSPVLLGFSGIHLPNPNRLRSEVLGVYSAMGLELAQQLTIPCALVFNESPNKDWVLDAIKQNFGLVMYSDERKSLTKQVDVVQEIVEIAHHAGVAVEGEVDALQGIDGNLESVPDATRMTKVDVARDFVEQTGVDAFAVNIGQMHLHGRHQVRLNLDLLGKLREVLHVPLVLHGATSITEDDLREAINHGIRKVNLGSVLKQIHFKAIKTAIEATSGDYNPYQVLGSGTSEDVLMAGRIALQSKVEHIMHVIGSAGKAKSFQ
jgi:fructose-bisphosphate aldolase class II